MLVKGATGALHIRVTSLNNNGDDDDDDDENDDVDDDDNNSNNDNNHNNNNDTITIIIIMITIAITITITIAITIIIIIIIIIIIMSLFYSANFKQRQVDMFKSDSILTRTKYSKTKACGYLWAILLLLLFFPSALAACQFCWEWWLEWQAE